MRIHYVRAATKDLSRKAKKTTEGTKEHGASMTADGFSEPLKTPRLPNPIRFASAFWWSLNGGRCRKMGFSGARGIPSPT